MLEKHVNSCLCRNFNFENVLSYKAKYSKVVKDNRITAEKTNEFIYLYSLKVEKKHFITTFAIEKQ